MKHTYTVHYENKEENDAKLAGCSGHSFKCSETYRDMWTCENCFGLIPSEFYVWWIDGIKHGQNMEKEWQRGQYAEIHAKLCEITGDLVHCFTDQWPGNSE